MINDMLGELVPNMDVEPIDPACTCGCGCMTKSATLDTGVSAAVVSR
jgi:hypothetical protein